MDQAELDRAEALLNAHPDYRVMRRLAVHNGYGPPPSGRPVLTGLIIDTETTGLEATDRVIELAILRFEFDAGTCQIYRITDSYGAYEDAGVPIAESATRVHGITQAHIEGKKFDDATVERICHGAHLVIAHNARFDRVMIEKRYPLFAGLAWGCSYSEVAWKDMGFAGSSLEFIANRCGFFYEAHGAMMDCRALLEVLHKTEDSARPPLRQILTAASRVDEKIWALNAPFESKDILRSRGYRWYPEEPKAWWIALPRAEAFEERKWLLQNVYQKPSVKMRVDVMDAFSRYSERITDSKVRTVSLTDSDQPTLDL